MGRWARFFCGPNYVIYVDPYLLYGFFVYYSTKIYADTFIIVHIICTLAVSLVVEQEHERAIVSATGYGFDSHWRK